MTTPSRRNGQDPGLLLPTQQALDLQLPLQQLVLDISLPFTRPDLQALARHEARLRLALPPHHEHETEGPR